MVMGKLSTDSLAIAAKNAAHTIARNLTIEADETDLSIADVPENEVFPVEELGEFRIKLCNVVD